MDFLAGHFDLIRGLHIIFVMAWIAGMLILPRLFVYHMKTEPGSEMDAVLSWPSCAPCGSSSIRR